MIRIFVAANKKTTVIYRRIKNRLIYYSQVFPLRLPLNMNAEREGHRQNNYYL